MCMRTDLPHDYVMQCLDASALGDGTLYAELFRGEYVHNNALKDEWMRWNGSFWELDAMHEYARRVEDVAQVYAAQMPVVEEQIDKAMEKNQEGLAKWHEKRKIELERRVRRLRGQAGADECLNFAWKRIPEPMAVTGDEFDQDPWIVGCKNGTIDLRTGDFREGQRNEWRTKTLNVEWPGWPKAGEKSKCPTIERFLWDICESEAMKGFMKRWFGYCMGGSIKFQKFLFLAGDGRNGKGVLLEMMMRLMGTYGGPIQSEMLLDQGRVSSSSSHSADIVNLRGMRFVVASESDEGRRFSPSRVKWLTGGDTLTGRRPNAARYETFEPTHKAHIMSNFPPHAPAMDYAFWDRMIYMLFPFTFKYNPKKSTEKARDDEILVKMLAELPYFLPVLVEGHMEAMADGLGIPDESLSAKASYRREEDSLQDYLDACVIEAPGNQIEAADFYKSFTTWWEENMGKRSKVPSLSWFGRNVGKKIEKRRDRTVKYLDIDLITS